MLPSNITREHVLQALKEIDRDGVPTQRDSQAFFLKHKTHFYPPQYVISIADKCANSQALPSADCTQDESNGFLERLGFEIVCRNIFSWEVLSDASVAKTLDRSAFLHCGTGIPREIVSFFGIDSLEAARREVSLILDNKSFDAHIQIDRQTSPRVQLFWKSDFAEMFRKKYPHLHSGFEESTSNSQYKARLVFEKSSSADCYTVEFTDAPE